MDTDALTLARERAAHNLPERLAWGPLTLSVTDLDRSVDFWTRVIGFVPRPSEAGGTALGTLDRTLVLLRPGATGPVAQGHAGMYHVAFGMASQAEFSRRIRHFAALGIGFSPVDHLMSKALYLSDPDGHGIEIAWETPERFGRFSNEGGRFTLIDADGNTHSGRERLDLTAELGLADGTDPALPLHRDTTVAHLHLHVPGLDLALDWFEGIGFARNLLLPDFGMADMGAGAPYTHRLAVNIWAGPGAKPAPDGTARLLEYTLYTPDAEAFEQATSQLVEEGQTGLLRGTDPAGVTLNLHLKHSKIETEDAV